MGCFTGKEAYFYQKQQSEKVSKVYWTGNENGGYSLEKLVKFLDGARKELMESGAVLFLFTLIGYIISEDTQGLFTPFAQGRLAFFSPLEAFVSLLKLSFFTGLFLFFPFLSYKLCKGLSANKRFDSSLATAVIVLGSSFLFYLGSYTGYHFVLPLGIKFLINFGGEVMEAFISLDLYISFCAKLVLAFGLAFELPLVLVILGRIGIIGAKGLVTFRKYAILLFAIFSAIITPPDVYSQLLMILCLTVLYEISVILVKIFGKKPPAAEISPFIKS